MIEIRFKVKSSSGGTYDITLERRNKLLVILCSCKAGSYGHFCKHKASLLNGDESILYDRDDASALKKVGEWLNQSQYIDLFAEYDSLKKQLEAAKGKERTLRRRIERMLVEGIPIGPN